MQGPTHGVREPHIGRPSPDPKGETSCTQSRRPIPPDTSAAPRNRLEALTGLRFYAAFGVILFHLSIFDFFALDGPAVRLGQTAFLNAGWLGVSFFFVLSGFVLTWSARPRDKAGRFFARRLAKIYPNHLFMFITVALISGGLGQTPLWQGFANLFLLQSWIPQNTAFFGVNGPSWSISAELFFYAMFPLLYLVIKRLRDRTVLTLFGVLVVLAAMLPFVSSSLPVGTRFDPEFTEPPLGGENQSSKSGPFTSSR